jgi:protein-disulfide isomerase
VAITTPKEIQISGSHSKDRPKCPRRIVTRLITLLFFVAAFGVWLGLDTGFWRGVRAAEAPSSTSKAEFEQRVHDYLLAHPEVIGEAINRLEAKQREAETSKAQVGLKSKTGQVYRDAASPVGGNPKGNVTLVEFFDYNCPYCRQMTSIMIEAEKADPQLRIVYKEFPILGPNSLLAAKAALAADRQGKYVAFHRALYQTRGSIDGGKVLEAAKTVGLDVDRLKTDMQDPKISSQLDKNIELARALNINGTPGFVIGEAIFASATDLKTLQRLIEQARKSPPEYR